MSTPRQRLAEPKLFKKLFKNSTDFHKVKVIVSFEKSKKNLIPDER
jgi:hypothetical protein